MLCGTHQIRKLTDFIFHREVCSGESEVNQSWEKVFISTSSILTRFSRNEITVFTKLLSDGYILGAKTSESYQIPKHKITEPLSHCVCVCVCEKWNRQFWLYEHSNYTNLCLFRWSSTWCGYFSILSRFDGAWCVYVFVSDRDHTFDFSRFWLCFSIFSLDIFVACFYNTYSHFCPWDKPHRQNWLHIIHYNSKIPLLTRNVNEGLLWLHFSIFSLYLRGASCPTPYKQPPNRDKPHYQNSLHTTRHNFEFHTITHDTKKNHKNTISQFSLFWYSENWNLFLLHSSFVWYVHIHSIFIIDREKYITRFHKKIIRETWEWYFGVGVTSFFNIFSIFFDGSIGYSKKLTFRYVVSHKYSHWSHIKITNTHHNKSKMKKI